MKDKTRATIIANSALIALFAVGCDAEHQTRRPVNTEAEASSPPARVSDFQKLQWTCGGEIAESKGRLAQLDSAAITCLASAGPEKLSRQALAPRGHLLSA